MAGLKASTERQSFAREALTDIGVSKIIDSGFKYVPIERFRVGPTTIRGEPEIQGRTHYDSGGAKITDFGY
jgi:hypothetical protein